MPRSEEAEAWYAAVCETVQLVPYGQVTSYGHIARLLGRPDCPRQVGTSLKALPGADSGQHFHNGNVPWQRVINAKGEISPRGPGGAARQAAAIQAEGVEVSRGSMGEWKIDFAKFGWFPDEIDEP